MGDSMRAHQIKNGKVINTIEVESLDVFPDLIEATEGRIGDVYDKGAFISPPEQEKERKIDLNKDLSEAEKQALITLARKK